MLRTPLRRTFHVLCVRLPTRHSVLGRIWGRSYVKILSPSDVPAPLHKNAIDETLGSVAGDEGNMLYEHDAYKVLQLMQVRIPRHVFVAREESSEVVSQHAQGLYGTLVAKAVIEGTSHKTNVGGVVLGLRASQLPDVFGSWKNEFGSSLHGVIFAEQINTRKDLGGELRLGMYQDPAFGPCLAVGFGGTHTDYLRTVVREGNAQFVFPALFDLESSGMREKLFRCPPIHALLGRVRGYGGRGAPTEEAVLDVLKAWQQVAVHFAPAYSIHHSAHVIQELEVNPMAFDKDTRSLVALDALLVSQKRVWAPSPSLPLVEEERLQRIHSLLQPKSLCVLGASEKKATAGTTILKKVVKTLSPGTVHAVHPVEKTIHGIPAHPSLKAAFEANNKSPYDCMVVAVRPDAAGAAIKEALQMGFARSIQIVTAGFAETQGGAAVQAELAQLLHDTPSDIRPVVNGPNTLGNVDRNGVDTVFTPAFKSSAFFSNAPQGFPAARAALICQSGACMLTRVSNLAGVVLPCLCASVGNQMDLSVTDFLRYVERFEPSIQSMGLYIEGLKDFEGMRLLSGLQQLTATDRFAVVYRSGRTKQGMQAAKGHTAAAAGDYALFRSLARLSGALVAESIREMEELLALTALLGKPLAALRHTERPVRVGCLSNAGFEKCAMADHLFRTEDGSVVSGVSLTRWSSETITVVHDEFTKHGLGGVMEADVDDILDLSPQMTDEGYGHIMRAVLADPGVDVALFSFVPETPALHTLPGEDFEQSGGLLDWLVTLRASSEKPFVVSLESGHLYDPLASLLTRQGIPTFRRADEAARALRKVLG